MKRVYSSITASITASILVAVPLFATVAQGQEADPHAGHTMMMSKKGLDRSMATYGIQDLPATTMSGERSTLSDQVSNEKIAVLNFIFITCTTICPVQTATLAQAQRQLGEQAGDVVMISVSIDPDHDTPARLREYAALFRAGPQWEFLTGSASESINIQKAFDAYHGAKMNHRPLTFIKAPGDEQWLRLEGMASAQDIVNEIQSIAGH